jgi:ubiquinone biosynthesis protein COQ4
LPAILDDHAALRRTPAGSLAHAYCDFMEREGLSAQGLVDEFDLFARDKPKFHDQFLWYMNRGRDVHDLLHVLTGYGRDGLGEACVLAFTYSQQPSPAHLFIGYLAGLNMKKSVKSGAPVLRAVREGQKLGKACPRLIEQSITDLLPLPLDDVRHRLNITPARQYQRAHAVWKSIGVDPYDMLGKQSANQAQGLAQAA